MTPEEQRKRVEAGAMMLVNVTPWSQRRAKEVLAAADRAVPVVSEEEVAELMSAVADEEDELRKRAERAEADYDLAVIAIQNASARAERAEVAAKAFAKVLTWILGDYGFQDVADVLAAYPGFESEGEPHV